MKRLTALLLVLSMLIAMTACTDTTPSAPVTPTTQAPAATDPVVETPPAGGNYLKIGQNLEGMMNLAPFPAPTTRSSKFRMQYSTDWCNRIRLPWNLNLTLLSTSPKLTLKAPSSPSN